MPRDIHDPAFGFEAPSVEAGAVLKMLSPKMLAKLTNPVVGDWRTALFGVIGHLVERDLADEVIESFIRAQPSGIGAEYAGRDGLDRGIARSRASGGKKAETEQG